MSFLTALAQSEMLTHSSRILTQITHFIFFTVITTILNITPCNCNVWICAKWFVLKFTAPLQEALLPNPGSTCSLSSKGGNSWVDYSGYEVLLKRNAKRMWAIFNPDVVSHPIKDSRRLGSSKNKEAGLCVVTLIYFYPLLQTQTERIKQCPNT